MSTELIVREVCAELARVYCSPSLGNPDDPVDDLIYILLSNRTSPHVATELYSQLRGAFPQWEALVDDVSYPLAEFLQPAGLSRTRARTIRSVLSKIRQDWGSCDLSLLKNLQENQVLEYLKTLPGVSNKVARCVMMYTLGFQVLPVDAHVYRLSKRLGWTDKNRADLAHAQLENRVPPELRRDFHVNAIAHGRNVCRPNNPQCHLCCVAQFCEAYRATLKRREL